MVDIIIVSIISGLVLLFIILSLIVGFGVFYQSEKTKRNTTNMPVAKMYLDALKVTGPFISILEKEKHEDVYVQSYDKKKLHGKLYKYNDSHKYAILFHGYKGTGIRDFSGGFFLVKDYGANILLIDHRAHLESEGHVISFGVKEHKDVLPWVNYIVNEVDKDAEIVLIGISMGAASLLMASDVNFPSNVKGIIADCPYTTPKEVTAFSCKNHLHIPLWIGVPLLTVGALFLGFSINGKDARKSVKNCKIPILIIHGEEDSIVPFKMSEEIFLANPNMITRHTFPNADHGLSYVADVERYKKVTNDFLNNIFK